MSDIAIYNRHLVELRAAVARLDTVEESKDLADKAAAAQVWAKRVKLGQEAVNHAAEVKLRAERRAGEVLAITVQHGGARRGISSSPTPNLKDLGVTGDQSSDWQRLASIPEPTFDQAIEEEKSEGEVTRAGVIRRSMNVHYSSETPEWETPQDLFNALNAEFGFELDVCAQPENAKCDRYFTPEDDGLEQDWKGVCWMNPPYGTEIGKWVAKAHEAGENGAVVVCLVPARVDTAWFWDHCRHAEVRFLRGRLRFGGGTMGAPFPSAVVIFGYPANVEWWEAWREAA